LKLWEEVIKKCKICGKEFHASRIYGNYKRQYCCSEKCKRERRKMYNKTYQGPYYIRKRKNWCRDNRLSNNGQGVRTIKRPYPKNNKCKVCQKVPTYKKKFLVYHHWGDIEVNNGKMTCGIWVCINCHRLIEYNENEKYKDRINRYHSLREQINVEVEEFNNGL